uniref:ApaG domain-containing protein n=1 Tax=Mesocestoides corti TaxID=53468 RepID=A0A5K3FYS2_MESCO
MGGGSRLTKPGVSGQRPMDACLSMTKGLKMIWTMTKAQCMWRPKRSRTTTMSLYLVLPPTHMMQVEADEKAHRRFSDASSETFPSFAKIRFSLDSLSSTSLWTCYTQDYPCSYFNTQRILISQPSMNTKPSPPSVFYYGELLGNPDYRGELGDHYSTLFTGDVLHAMQVHPESRQTSSPCPWYHYFISSHQSYWTNDSVFNLTNLFTFTEQRRPCGSNFSLDDDDGENLVQLSSKELEYSPQIFKSHEIAFDAEYEEEKEIEMQNMPVNGASSPTSSTTYHCSLFEYRPPKNSWRCFYDFNEAAISMNVQLRPRWHWMFRQTRWPLRFAPQQNIELSMNGIRIPPWRASAGRPLSDVSRFCSEHREMKNLVLLDPMVNFHLLF